MTNGEWTEFRATLSGKGYTQLTFTTSGIYFIDEVRVCDPTISGINDVKLPASPSQDDQRIYASTAATSETTSTDLARAYTSSTARK